MDRQAAARLGGLALKERRGMDHLRRIASTGGNTTVERYSVNYMRAIGSAGGLQRAARLRARLHASGVTLEASLGGT